MITVMDEIVEVLLRMNNAIDGGNETMENVENNFKKRERLAPMTMFSELGGKVIHGDSIDPNRYVKAEDVIK